MVITLQLEMHSQCPLTATDSQQPFATEDYRSNVKTCFTKLKMLFFCESCCFSPYLSERFTVIIITDY